jgi:diguanylate cyclase (GGDEF)-like protein
MSDSRRLAALIQAQETIAGVGLDGAATLLALSSHARELTGADGALVELVDANGQVTRAAADSAAVAVGVPLAEDVPRGRAFLQRRFVRADDAGGTVLAAPLMSGDDALGVLTITSAGARGFGEEDEHTLRVLARFGSHQLVQCRRMEQIERTSRTDPLTGLGNRRALDETLGRELARHVRYDRPLTVVLIDLDGFKQVNDVHGHAAGDTVLVQVGRRLASVRGADAAFRLGGDEFAIVMPETRMDTADLVARRLSRQIRDDTSPLAVHATWGIAQAVGDDPDELLAVADSELYSRKREGPPTAQADVR